jgi:hypothetical protein
VLTGKVKDISGNTLVLMTAPLDPANLLMVARDGIEEIAWSGSSPMPEGPLDSFTTQDVLDLPEFLLKPGNILLMADGTPKITDFGLAKSMGTNSGLTATETIMGSPSYMAPEQAAGRIRQIGPLADIYALGATLYELLTGRPRSEVRRSRRRWSKSRPSSPCRRRGWSRPAAGRRDDRAEVLAEGAGEALRLGRRAGRGTAAVPCRPADRGAAGPVLGTGLEVCAAPPGAA